LSTVPFGAAIFRSQALDDLLSSHHAAKLVVERNGDRNIAAVRRRIDDRDGNLLLIIAADRRNDCLAVDRIRNDCGRLAEHEALPLLQLARIVEAGVCRLELHVVGADRPLHCLFLDDKEIVVEAFVAERNKSGVLRPGRITKERIGAQRRANRAASLQQAATSHSVYSIHSFLPECEYLALLDLRLKTRGIRYYNGLIFCN
jgi:hypothetical protein